MAHKHVKQSGYLGAVFRPDSRAAVALAARTGASTLALVGGLVPHLEMNLSFHGGRTIPALAYFNFFVGGTAAWTDSDVTNINTSLANAMTDPNLNNVLQQYFPDDAVSATPLGARILVGAAPPGFTRSDVENTVLGFASDGTLVGVGDGVDLSSTVFNFMLPRGTLLSANQSPQPAAAQPASGQLEHSGQFEDEDSRNGLGGYHGSVRLAGDGNGAEAFAYYAVGVYSEVVPGHGSNGIPFFDQSWKDVVATFYHELCETRTDPDVEEVNRTKNDALLGWYSDHNGEIGDLPMELAGGQLGLVMQEVPLTNGPGTVPIQLQWSNALGSAEGPIDAPH